MAEDSLLLKINKLHRDLFPNLYVVTKNIYEYTIFYLNKCFGYFIEKRRFRKKLGYKLDLKNPRNFNEKIIWKKIYERSPLLTRTADKYEVRNYVKEVLGEEEGNNLLIPLLYVTNKPKTIPFDILPKDFVIKANHGNGWNIIVRNGIFDKKEIIKKCKQWLKIPYGVEKIEWGYKDIKRKIIIEEFISDENGDSPKDYKFQVMNGEVKLIQVFYDRFDDLKNSNFTKDWKYLNFMWPYKQGENMNKPKNLEKMIKLAEILGSAFSHVRIDFYSVNDKIYFGEITHYPSSGLAKFRPEKFDFDFGDEWRLN
jgi:hypothetical protein